MKRLALHIGVKKTGTTTLQKFLEVNRRALLEKGFVYLLTPGARWSSKLAGLAKTHRDPNAVPDDFLQRLAAEVRAEAQQGRSCAIASFEGLVDLGPRDIECLFDSLSTLFEEISVHVYLRRQDLAVMSHYSTALRGGGTRATMLPATPDLKNPALNYEVLLDRWAAAVGESRIHPRIFQTEDLTNGDLLEDFLCVLGISPDHLVRPSNVNVALSDEAKLFLRTFNKHVPARVGDKPNPLRGPVFHLLDKYDGPRKMSPSRGQAIKFYEPFRASNQQVAKRWFPGRTVLFREDFAEYPENEVHGELTAEGAIRIASHLWQSLMRQKVKQEGGDVPSSQRSENPTDATDAVAPQSAGRERRARPAGRRGLGKDQRSG
ncbi:hypothetical protein [Reyranella sp.]|uniref:hypothetical protein n=1 Tax=Reyranella sp. TaxID=1929291 RepID=UPI003BAD3DC2